MTDTRPALAIPTVLIDSLVDRLRRVDGVWKIAERQGSIKQKLG